MTNQDHIDRLKNSKVDEWNQWRAENEYIKIDLREADFRKADFHGADLREADLRGADFYGANLREADLRGATLRWPFHRGVVLHKADLRGANLRLIDLFHANLDVADLRGAKLQGASLFGAKLYNTNLAEANLSGADLYMAELSGASLFGANLFNVDFAEADLSGTDMSEARINRTKFFNTNLRDAKNLESCVHGGPSNVDHLTIENSGGLPTIFLRGCGLPEKLVEYYPSLLNQSISFYSCFISYSHADKLFAQRLHDQLQGRGIRCWLDEHQIRPGDDIYAEVEKGLKLWDKVLLCASEKSLNSWWVEREIDRAFKREMELTKTRSKTVLSIIPLNLDGYLFEWEHAHASALQKRLASDFVGWETNNSKFEASFENIVKALQTNETEREKPPESKL